MGFCSGEFFLEKLSFYEYYDDNFYLEQLEQKDVPTQKEDLPWADIMQQLEIPISGNEEDDFNDILDEIRNKINSAKSKYDLNYYEWLIEHTYRVFTTLDESCEEYKYSDFILDSEFEEFVNLAAS